MFLLFAVMTPRLGDTWSVDAILENGRRLVTAPAAAKGAKPTSLRTRYPGTLLDYDKKTGKIASPAMIAPASTFCILCQLAGCYFQTGWNKLYRNGGAEWDWENLTAVRYSIHIHKWMKWPAVDMLYWADKNIGQYAQPLLTLIGGGTNVAPYAEGERAASRFRRVPFQCA